MKRIIFIMAAAMSLAACNQNTPDDTKKGGDDTTSQHQPSDPATWSPVGKVYMQYVPTNELPPDTIRWLEFYNLPELGEDSAIVHIKYETKGSKGYVAYQYSINYPDIVLSRDGKDDDYATFRDTLNIVMHDVLFTCD